MADDFGALADGANGSMLGKLCLVFDLRGETFDVAGKTFDVGAKTFDVANETFDVANETFDVGTKTFDVGTKTFDVGRQTFDVGAETSDVRALTFEVGTEFFEVFGVKSSCHRLVLGSLRKNPGFLRFPVERRRPRRFGNRNSRVAQPSRRRVNAPSRCEFGHWRRDATGTAALRSPSRCRHEFNAKGESEPVVECRR